MLGRVHAGLSFLAVHRHRPHVTPTVSMGDSLAPSTMTTKRRPSILVPWLAAGVGLAALSAIPDPSLTDVAGAEPLPRATGFRSDQTQAFTATLTETAVLAAPSARATTSSAASSIDLDVLAEAQRTTIENEHGGAGAPGIVESLPLWTNRTFAAAPTQRPRPTEQQWAALRACEASDNYAVTNFSGKYRGAYQFDLPTWESVGGTGDPAAATAKEQDLRAALLHQQRGSSPWPFCGQYLD